MTEFEQMNTFFIIASAGFVIFIFFGILIGYYLSKLLKKLNSIADNAKEISEDTRDVAKLLHDDITQARSVVSGLFSFLAPKKKSVPKKRSVK